MSYVVVEEKGRRVRLAIVRTAKGVWVGWPGGARFFGPERREAAAGASAPTEIRAPMTARVVKVAAAAGSAVQPDETLVILQAMKMEYRLTSPRAGSVDRVLCAEGEMVDLGALLVTLLPAASGAEPARGGAREGGQRKARKSKR